MNPNTPRPDAEFSADAIVQRSRNANEILDRVERAATIYRHEMENRNVPAHLIPGLVRYLVHRIRPGHFLVAVLASDMREAWARAADGETQRGIGTIVIFLAQVCPANCWGSYEALELWLVRDDELGMLKPKESAQPCGCDPGAHWICEQHRKPDAHLGAVIENHVGGER